MSRNDNDDNQYNRHPAAAAAAAHCEDGDENDQDERVMEMNNNTVLMDLLQDEKWNGILENLKHQQRQQQQQQPQTAGDESSSSNHNVGCWSLSFPEQVALVWSNTCSIKHSSVVPIEFVQALFALLASNDKSDDNDCMATCHHPPPDANAVSMPTFLHTAVTHCAHRPDIIQVILLSHSPTTTTGTTMMMMMIQQNNVVDAEGLRPIDILTQRILMKEERMRYRSKQQQSQSLSSINNSTDLDDCWESARLLAISHAAATAADVMMRLLQPGEENGRVGGPRRSGAVANVFPTATQFPLLHACCLAMDTLPHSLLQRAMRRCPQEEFTLRAEAIHGNTPLHCTAAAFRRPVIVAVIVEDQQEQQQQDENEVVDTDDDDTDNDNSNSNFNDDLLGEVLRREPKAAGVLNHNNQYPLNVAILAGRTWKSGCRRLLEAHPAAILHVLPSETNETNDDKRNDSCNYFDTASSRQSQRLLMEVFSKTDNASAASDGGGGGGFNLTYSILHVIQPQVLFE